MSEVALERDGAVAFLRFASGRRGNAIGEPLVRALHERVAEVAADPPRVLVLSGRPDVFSVGADVESVGALDAAAFRAFVELEYALFAAVEELPLVTIAALAGACIGNAAELALACDLRVAQQRTKLGLPEVRAGFAAPAQRLSRYVGIGRAKQLLYSGAVLSAAEAHALGLLNEVVPDGELEAAARRLAAELAALEPRAVRHTKANVARAYAAGAADFAAEIDGVLGSVAGR